MTTKTKNLLLVCLMAALLFTLSLTSWFKAEDSYSDSERRLLASFPKLSRETILSGKFMSDFELYTQDQFPLRESFRGLKAAAVFYGMGQLDNNELYMTQGHISQLSYPLNERMTEHAAERFRFVYEKYLQQSDAKLYFSIIPDKNYFLAESGGYLHLDYDELVSQMRQKTDYMEYIDIFPLLSIDDYYRTDSHWRQERVIPVSEALLLAMGAQPLENEYVLNTLSQPFYGVYSGQIALPVKPDSINYLTSAVLDNCIVTSYNTGRAQAAYMYDMQKAAGRDPYEMFLSGNDALITVENPAAKTDRELIVFRDSFGSSIVPLMAESYAKITVVDLRYLNSAMLGSFIAFDDQDVLFLYSTMLLNNSLAIK